MLTTDASELTAYELATLADCATPDSSESAGSHFLVAVRDTYRDAAGAGEDLEDARSYGLDAALPVYTGELWATFTDLAAYREDVTELGPIEELTDAANRALYLIADRLWSALTELDADGEG